ncbi:hypothetical protein HDU67_002776, partial [Dinochytrium kinnereticum]
PPQPAPLAPTLEAPTLPERYQTPRHFARRLNTTSDTTDPIEIRNVVDTNPDAVTARVDIKAGGSCNKPSAGAGHGITTSVATINSLQSTQQSKIIASSKLIPTKKVTATPPKNVQAKTSANPITHPAVTAKAPRVSHSKIVSDAAPTRPSTITTTTTGRCIKTPTRKATATPTSTTLANRPRWNSSVSTTSKAKVQPAIPKASRTTATAKASKQDGSVGGCFVIVTFEDIPQNIWKCLGISGDFRLSCGILLSDRHVSVEAPPAKDGSEGLCPQPPFQPPSDAICTEDSTRAASAADAIKDDEERSSMALITLKAATNKIVKVSSTTAALQSGSPDHSNLALVLYKRYPSFKSTQRPEKAVELIEYKKVNRDDTSCKAVVLYRGLVDEERPSLALISLKTTQNKIVKVSSTTATTFESGPSDHNSMALVLFKRYASFKSTQRPVKVVKPIEYKSDNNEDAIQKAVVLYKGEAAAKRLDFRAVAVHHNRRDSAVDLFHGIDASHCIDSKAVTTYDFSNKAVVLYKRDVASVKDLNHSPPTSNRIIQSVEPTA